MDPGATAAVADWAKLKLAPAPMPMPMAAPAVAVAAEGDTSGEIPGEPELVAVRLLVRCVCWEDEAAEYLLLLLELGEYLLSAPAPKAADAPDDPPSPGRWWW